MREHLITPEQLNDACAKQVGAKRPLHELLVEMGFFKEEDLLKVASKIYNMPMADFEKEAVDPEVINLVPYEMAERHGAFPVRREDNALVLAVSNPQDVDAMDSIRAYVNMNGKPILCSKNCIHKAHDKYYKTEDFDVRLGQG